MQGNQAPPGAARAERSGCAMAAPASGHAEGPTDCFCHIVTNPALSKTEASSLLLHWTEAAGVA